MTDTVKCPEQFVFGLDIGTRSIVGTVGYMDNYGFHVIAMDIKEHDTRAMLDGQVHDIAKVAEEIVIVRKNLEAKIGRPLKQVCIAAAGRVLRTITVKSQVTFEDDHKITDEDIYNLDFSGVELAHRQINEQEGNINFYCVGYTPVKYFLNDYEIGNLEGHKGSRIAVELLATFLPEEVVDGLYASVEKAGLEVANLTLEPIAAMNVAIPEQYRLLNIALVDVGAGTSDICITRDGSVVAYGMIPSAGDEISEIIAKHYLVDFTCAEKLKLAAGGKKNVSFKDIMGMKHSVSPEEIKTVTTPVASRLAEDVAGKIIELNGGKAVSAVFIVGGGGKIPGFSSLLAKSLSLPEERVALRGKEVLGGVEFAVTNVKKDSLFVTPIGICINYYNQKNNFIYVTVNGDRIKLYDNSRLTVVDAIMQADYPNDKLFPRRGEPVSYTLNGTARMIRGTMGEPAVILKNGKEASMNTPVEKNDYIDITESTIGNSVELRIEELPEYKSTISFYVNDIRITCPKFAYVNGVLESENYIIRNNDDIVMENYYTVGQLFEFMDINPDEADIMVNNEAADINTLVYENFSVKYVINNVPEDTHGSTEPVNEEEPVKITDPVHKNDSDSMDFPITVNGTKVILKNKKEYRFVDVFDFYPFDMTKMGGNELVTRINGVKAEFTDILPPNAGVDLYWN